MPRRQRGAPRWRRNIQQQPPSPVVTIKGRHARVLVRELAALNGGQATKEGKGNNAAASANDVLASTGAWRHRRTLPPFAWGAGMAVLGAAMRFTPNPVLFGVLGGAAAAGLMFGFTRHLTTFARRWTDVAAFLTAAWVPFLAAFGFGAPAPALLALTWAACSAPLWRHYRIRPGEREETAEDTTSDQARWERLAAKRKWSGKIENPEKIPGGRKYEINLVGAETHIGEVMAHPRPIAATWDKPMTEAYVEAHPTAVESKGILTILNTGTLEATQEWDGKGFNAQGIARIGRFADNAPCRIRAWVPKDGARHGMIAGTVGAGKTELLNELLWLAVTSEVPVVPVVLDPQNGQSLPQWQDKVLYFSGIEACALASVGLHAGMMDRSKRLASLVWDDEGHKAKGMNFFDPILTGWPVLLVIMDEAPLLLADRPNLVRYEAEGGKLGRKAGVSKWYVAQLPSLNELGGDQGLRSVLVGGNVVCLRTGDRVSAGMLGLEQDPSALPKYFPDGSPTYGLGYTVTMDNRQAPMRTDLVPPLMRHQPVTVPQLEDDFKEAMNAAIAGLLNVNTPAASDPDEPADDAPTGRRCIDAVLQVLTDRGESMSRGDIEKWARELVTSGWGRPKPYGIRQIQNALTQLVEDGRAERAGQSGDGMYRATGNR